MNLKLRERVKFEDLECGAAFWSRVHGYEGLYLKARMSRTNPEKYLIVDLLDGVTYEINDCSLYDIELAKVHIAED